VIRMGQTFGPLIAALSYGLWGLSGTFFAGSVLSLSVLSVLFFLIPGLPD
jgi:hypothetical protein